MRFSVHMFYGSPLNYLWDDEEGTAQTIPGESEGSGEALMPLALFGTTECTTGSPTPSGREIEIESTTHGCSCKTQ